MLLLSLSVTGTVAAEALRIRYKMEDPRESFLALGAGRLDGVVSTIDTMIPDLKTGKEFQYVLALDDSAGGGAHGEQVDPGPQGQAH